MRTSPDRRAPSRWSAAPMIVAGHVGASAAADETATSAPPRCYTAGCAMPVIIAFFILLFGSAVLIVNRLLTHRERMAELEARRPYVTLQLPPGTDVEALAGVDDLTRQIEEACRAKGIELDVDIE